MNQIAFIRSSIQSLLIGQTFLVLLITLLIALFYYSTPSSRRQTIFILNIIALIVALTTCLTAHILQIHMIMSPQGMGPAQARLVTANIFFGTFQGMLADTILLVRLIVVHPPSRIGIARFVLLTSLPTTLKIARVVNLIIFTIRLSSMANGPNGFLAIAASGWLTGQSMKTEWVAQVVDNSYASIAFLWTLRAFRTDTTTPEDSVMSIVSFRQSSFSQRVRTLFNLALSNYLIPTIMSIAQVALAFRFGDTDAAIMNEVVYVNTMVSVCGVAFATVWAAKERRQDVPRSVGEEKRRCTCGQDKWRGPSHAPLNSTVDTEGPESDKTSCSAYDQALQGTKLHV